VKSLLKVTAIIEALTGLALVGAPSLVASVLLNVALEEFGALIVARITGFALCSLAIACWQARNNSSPAIAQAMLFYNVSVAVPLLYCIFVEKLSGL
jgi:hypothetical protein